MKTDIGKVLGLIVFFGFWLLLFIVPGDSQVPGQQVPIYGNATKLIDTSNEEFGVAHTAGVLQTIVNSSALPSGASTSANQNSLLTELQLKADLTETQPVSLITGFATSALQLADNHNVVVSSSALPSGAATLIGQSFDPMLEISMGNVSGMSHVNKFGENPDVTKNTTEDIWDSGGTYSFPTSALMTKISQTTDQGDLQGETIEVQGLDANWDLVIQDVILNAANTETPTVLTTPLIRCFRMKVLANFVTTSSIRVHNDDENVDYAVIQTGNNQTLMAIYTVPNGKTAYITSYYAGTAPTGSGTKDPYSVEFKLWMADRANSYEFQLKHEISVIQDGVSHVQYFFKPYLVVTQKTDIKLTAGVSNDWNGHVHAGFDIILVDN